MFLIILISTVLIDIWYNSFMFVALSIYFFILGVIIGSFLNVVILRYNTGKTIGGRSACMTCKTKLTWRELIPIFSFLFQRGRCKTCKTKLKLQYLFVELTTGILFLVNFIFWVYHASSSIELLISFGLTTCILACMIVIFVYDLRHKIIPDLFSYTAWGLSVLFVIAHILFQDVSTKSFIDIGSTYTTVQDNLISITNIIAGLSFYSVIWLIWRLSKGRLIGLGDAKLLLSIGTILGFIYGLSSIFISVWIATLYAIYILLKHNLSKRGKHITMKTEIPFGPFLIIGFLIVYFFGIDVTGIGMIVENFS